MAVHPLRARPPHGEATTEIHPDVAVVEWPAQEAERRRLADSRRPRLLVVPADAPAPVCVDPLEDWVREPVDSGEASARAQVLAERYFPD